MLQVKEPLIGNQVEINNTIAMVSQAMQDSLLAKKADYEIADEMFFERALVAYWGDELVGYISYAEWGDELIEIMTVFVKQEYRNKGIGSYLVKCMYYKLKHQFQNKRIVVLPNKNSYHIFKELGFSKLNPSMMPVVLRKACSGCKDYDKYPACHCSYMEMFDPEKITYNYIPDITIDDYYEKYIYLYQQMWVDAPWCEDWSINEVEIEAFSYQEKEKPIFIIATINNQPVGFCNGYVINKEQMKEKSGHDKFDKYFDNGKKVFYAAEIGVINGLRVKGLGLALYKRLIEFAKMQGSNLILGRTKALEAIHLLEKLGFESTFIADASDSQRQYYKKEL